MKLIVLVGALCALLVGCSNSGPSDGNRLPVVASIYPLEYFATRIGGDLVEVVGLVPPGVEAHAFELTPGDLERIASAPVVLMNGLEMEPWLERALDALGSDFAGAVVEAADPELAREGEEHENEEHEDEAHENEEHEDEAHGNEEHEDEAHGNEEHEDEAHGNEEHEHGLFDPHMWLDPVLARTQAKRVLDALVTAAPEHATTFASNAAALDADLAALHDDFEAGLASCTHHSFVTSHAAYGYLADRYGLTQVEVAGLTPGAEPTPSRLAAVTDLMRERGLSTVLVEPLMRDLVAEALASEADASVRTIHPLGSVTDSEIDSHGDYLGLMRDNLASLREALDCAT